MPEEEVEAKKTYKHRRFGKKTFLAALIFILLAGAAALAWYQLVYSGLIPYKYRKQVHTVLYYPQNLPANLYVDRTSFDVPVNNVLTYIVRDNKGSKFYISQQPSVDNFNFSKFKQKFENTDSIDTPNGSALVGDLGNQLVASLNTPENTWIIINTNAITKQAELGTIARAMNARQ